MKKLPLTVKIWLSLLLVSLLLYLIFLLIIPFTIRSFLAPAPQLQDISQQKRHLTSTDSNFSFPFRQFIVLENGSTVPAQAGETLPAALIKEISERANSQTQYDMRYEFEDDQVRYRYVIRKDEAYGHPLYQVSIITRKDENRFVEKLLIQFMLFAGGALVISWFASLFIARHLTQPLVQMERHVRRIAGRDWHNPIEIKYKDELGQLAHSIESMRKQLIRQEEAQQSMLQNISHELKTPVMVIRSHAQAMQDGIYPNGDLNRSIQIIDDEGARLENLIKQLIYLTRLDYLATQKEVSTKIQLDVFIKEISEKMRCRRLELEWELNLQPVIFEGDQEKWRVLAENILDNQLRYALSKISITLSADNQNNKISIIFWNDGPFIDPLVSEKIFQPFRKGREGKYGLGLTIAQRIVKMYCGKIEVFNEADNRKGVSTCIEIPIIM